MGRDTPGAPKFQSSKALRTAGCRSVTATAPIRVCDVGGWTDTWFAAPGKVCSLAVGPGVTATAALAPRTLEHHQVRLVAPDIKVDHFFGPECSSSWDTYQPQSDALIEHVIAEVLSDHPLPSSQSLTVTVVSSVPPGASLGTSAAVLVATLAALITLLADVHVDPTGLAEAAHRVETARARRQAGVQDYWAAALGGAVMLEVDPYPIVNATRVETSADFLDEVRDRLVTVVFGSHDSSAVHQQVIQRFTSKNHATQVHARETCARLVRLAVDAARALSAGNLNQWAAVLTASTDTQRQLHHGLIGPDHLRATAVAKASRALGWKVNGAGGTGGSLTIVSKNGGAESLKNALTAFDQTWKVLDLGPSTAGVSLCPNG